MPFQPLLRWLRIVFALIPMAPQWAVAGDVETQHAFDVTLPVRPRLELTLHSRVRTQPGGLGLYQVRVGPIATWDATTRLSVLGGYYYAQQERKIDNDFIGGHRLFGGVEGTLWDTRRFYLEQRAVMERFLSDSTDDFNRYRLRTRLSMKAPVAPYMSHEFFFDAKGWRSNRHSAGIRWSVARNVQMDMGYLYEHRRHDVGPHRHMWLTSLHWKRTERRADPDI